jgi:hypothetical protein
LIGFVGVETHLNVDARAEAVDDGEEAVKGETAEVGVADAGEVGGGDAGTGVGGAYGQLFLGRA